MPETEGGFKNQNGNYAGKFFISLIGACQIGVILELELGMEKRRAQGVRKIVVLDGVPGQTVKILL